MTEHPLNPHISVDCVVFGYDFEELSVLLTERSYFTDEGRGEKIVLGWALPGNLVRDDETLDNSANRIIQEVTGFGNIYLEKFSEFGDPNRLKGEKDKEWLRAVREQPDARVVTIAYFGLVKSEEHALKTDSVIWKTEWHPINKIPKLAFDHNQIIEEALQSLRVKLIERPIAFELLPMEFTLAQLQKLYEAILGKTLDKRNFIRKMKKLDLVLPTDKKVRGAAHKPASVYRYNKQAAENLRKLFSEESTGV